MKRIHVLGIATLTLGLFLATGCQDESATDENGASDARSDIRMDSRTPVDTEPEDSGDTAAEDGATEDTSPEDTSRGDTATEDSGSEDTASDTAAMDTGSDTAEMDTGADTAPEDTGSDTTSKDTSGDTDADGGFECPEQQNRVCNSVITCYENQSTGNCCKYSTNCPLKQSEAQGWTQLQNCRSDCKDVTSR